MADFTHELFDNREFKRSLIISSIDINTGEIVIFDETLLPENRGWAILATSAIPVFFPPVSAINPHQMLVDGGLFANLEMDESILKCRAQGFDDEHIIVDMIQCHNNVEVIEPWDVESAKFQSAYDFNSRRDSFTHFYWFYEEVLRVIRGFPKVQFRHLLTPKGPLGGSLVPIFDGAG